MWGAHICHLSFFRREDLRKFQALQNICHNIRDNLEAIKNFKKVSGYTELTHDWSWLRRPSCPRGRRSTCLSWMWPSTGLSTWRLKISSLSWGSARTMSTEQEIFTKTNRRSRESQKSKLPGPEGPIPLPEVPMTSSEVLPTRLLTRGPEVPVIFPSGAGPVTTLLSNALRPKLFTNSSRWVSVWRGTFHVCHPHQFFSLHGDRKGSGTQLTLRRNFRILHYLRKYWQQTLLYC